MIHPAGGELSLEKEREDEVISHMGVIGLLRRKIKILKSMFYRIHLVSKNRQDRRQKKNRESLQEAPRARVRRTAETGRSRQGDSYSASERARLWVQVTIAGRGRGRHVQMLSSVSN